MPAPFSERLRQLSPRDFEAATTHTFLARAGAGTLAAQTLKNWLVQNVHYTRSYVRFASALLATVQLGSSSDSKTSPQHDVFSLVFDALINIQREMAFFDDVSRRYELHLEEEPQQRTLAMQAYAELFDAVSARSATAGPLEALTLLWATEFCYLEAWSYAQSKAAMAQPASGGNKEDENARLVLHDEFIPNWTNQAFAEFVARCESVLDRFADEHNSRLTEAEQARFWDQCAATFGQVLQLEIRFWPSIV